VARERSPRARKLIAGLAVGTIIGALAAAGAYFRPGFLAKAENVTYDVRIRRAAVKTEADPAIVMIHIDEKSIRNAERNFDGISWPWNRQLYAYMTEYIARGNPKAIIYDFYFPSLLNRQTGYGDEVTFADAMGKSGRTVIGLYMSTLPRADRAEDRWATRLTEFPTRREAIDASLRLLAFSARVFLIGEGDGKTQVWLGGGADAEDAKAIWTRTSAFASVLEPFFAIPAEGAEPPAPPEPVQLTEAQMKAELTDADYARDRTALAIEKPTDLRLPSTPHVDAPLSLLTKQAHLGGVTQTFDADGVLRRYAPVVESGGVLYPSIALAAWKVAHPEAKIGFEGRDLVLGDARIPLDENGRFGIKYHGNADVYEAHSAYEILASYMAVEEERQDRVQVPASAFKDKYVIISATAIALADRRPTPISERQEGASINATALDNLLHASVITRAPAWLDALVAFLLAFVLGVYVMAIWTAIASGPIAFAVTSVSVLALLGGYLLVANLVFDTQQLWLAVVLPVGGGIVSTIAALLVESVVERKDRSFVQQALGRYTSKALVSQLIEHPEYLSLGGQKREISCYFSDIAGFTSISEVLTAERLVDLLNDYLTLMSEIVDKYGGYVDKYIGDAVMAFWGGLIPDEKHATHAVLAAIDMRTACLSNAARWKKEYGADVMARAGVNSGMAVVGNMGSRDKYNYTVMGDMVNLASRLEGGNKPYGTLLMISEFTYEKCKEDIEVRTLDLMTVKGKEQAVTVYEVLAATGQVDPKLRKTIDLFHEGLAFYRGQKWIEAIDKFNAALNVQEDGPSRHYIKRCEHFLDEPPGDNWDGVWHMKEK
jgi:adenylate cyclase